MYELSKIGKVFTSKFVGTGPSSYEKRIYRPAVSRRLRNTGLYDRVGQGCTNLERQIARTIKFRPVGPMFGSSVWNLLHISPQVPRLLRWLLYTLQIINS